MSDMRQGEVSNKASKVDGIIAVTNKHTAKLHHVGSFYIYYLMMHGNPNIKFVLILTSMNPVKNTAHSVCNIYF